MDSASNLGEEWLFKSAIEDYTILLDLLLPPPYRVQLVELIFVIDPFGSRYCGMQSFPVRGGHILRVTDVMLSTKLAYMKNAFQ
jgi:hypothetical protein